MRNVPAICLLMLGAGLAVAAQGAGTLDLYSSTWREGNPHRSGNRLLTSLCDLPSSPGLERNRTKL
jgi:hypothetical protein